MKQILVMTCPHCGKGIYKPDGRGGPKIDLVSVEQTILKFGSNVSRTQVAAELNVTESAIRAWLKRNGKTWRGLKVSL